MSIGNTVKDGSGSMYWLLVDADGRLIVADAADTVHESDVTLNDSDKTFTVTAGEEWEILSIWVEFTSTATAGARQIVVELQDASSDVIAQLRAEATVAQSQTRYILWAQGAPHDTAFISTDYMSHALPKIFLPAGYKIRVYDSAAIDAAADDMIVHMMVRERLDS